MIRGAVLCEGKKCSEDFAFQFIADIRDATNFYEICVSEEIWDIGAVPCRLAVLEREFQSEVVEICFAAAFCEQFGKFYGRLTHCAVDRKNIYAVLLRICFFESVQNLFGIVSINLFEDFQNLFRCQFVLIISCRCKRCELAVYGSDHHRNLMCMLTEACVEWISIEVIALFRAAADVAATLCNRRSHFCICSSKLRIRYSFQLSHIVKAERFHHCRNNLRAVFLSCAERIVLHNTAHDKAFLEQAVC